MMTCPFKNSKTYLEENKNSSLALLTLNQKLNLLEFISNRSIKLNKKLNFNKNNTFGIEIEFSGTDYYNNEEMYCNLLCDAFKCDYDIDEERGYIVNDWGICKDSSSSEVYEFISPRYTDNDRTYDIIKKVYKVLDKNNLNYSDNCSLQISVGGHIFENSIEKLVNFLKIYAIYEKELYSFTKYENAFIRSNSSEYALPIGKKLITAFDLIEKYLDNIEYLINDLNVDNSDLNINAQNIKNDQFHKIIYNLGTHCDTSEIRKDKNSALNIKSIKLNEGNVLGNRMEFRFPNATKKIDYVINTINAFMKLVENTIETNPLSKYYFSKYKNEILKNDIYDSNNYSTEEYSECDFDKILELCDIIFDNNLDKYNFLTQAYNDYIDLEVSKQKLKNKYKTT